MIGARKIVAQGRHRVAKGCRRTEVMREIGVNIDDETLAELRTRAISENTSLSHQVRVLIEIGLETLRADAQ